MSKRGFKHHVLPQVYLKQFTCNSGDSPHSGLLYARRREWDEWRLLHPKSIGFKRGFYSIKPILHYSAEFFERFLAKVEGEFGRVVKEVLIPMNDLGTSEQVVLSYFLALMHSRTLEPRESINALPKKIIEKIMWNILQFGVSDEKLAIIEDPKQREEFLEFQRTMTKEKAIEFMENTEIEIESNIFHLKWISKSMSVLGRMFMHKQWSVLYDKEGRLITSDNPTCTVPQEDFGPYPPSPAFPSVLVTLPLTKHHLLTCVNERESDYVPYVPVDRSLVDYANYAQIVQWKEWLISPTPFNVS